MTFVYPLEREFCCSNSLFLRTRRNSTNRRHKPATQGRINKHHYTETVFVKLSSASALITGSTRLQVQLCGEWERKIK